MAEEKPELGEILARLEKVERQNRNLKRGALLAMLLVAMLLIMGQATSDRAIEADSVEAHKILADVIQLSDKEGNTALLMPGFITVQSKAKSIVFISSMQDDGPSVRVVDKEGFQTWVGATALVTPKTGAQQQTSAASVILFGKDKKVLWSAP